MNFKNEAISMEKELISIRRYLHQHPELGFEEENTSRYIKEILRRNRV
mgnify:FL=1